MIIIVDYGMGNLFSVKRAMEYVCPNQQVKISNQAQDIQNASKIILPGQGAMQDCMKLLNNSNLRQVLLTAITEQKKPTLGICVGMQMLFQSSEEGNTEGLGILNGRIEKFKSSELKVPQMGWNNVEQQQVNDRNDFIYKNIWHNILNNSFYYFIHSYYLPINAATKPYVIGKSNYGIDFASVVTHENILATQFHPEKSSYCGLELYKNFANI